MCSSPFRNVLNPNGLIAKGIKPARMEVSITISLNNLCFSSDVQPVEVASFPNTNPAQMHQNQQSLSVQTKNPGTAFTTANANSTNNSISVLTNTSYSGGEKNNTIRALSNSVHVGKSTIHLGDKQTVTIKVTDTNTTNLIAVGKVNRSILDTSSSPNKSLDGTTDNTGEYIYSWTVGHNDATGSYKVEAQVSSSGYVNDTAPKSFKVISTQ